MKSSAVYLFVFFLCDVNFVAMKVLIKEWNFVSFLILHFPWECFIKNTFLGRYLVGCDNVLAKLHTKHPELCDKVGGLLAMHIDDLRALAPMWLSKTEEVREDRAHWATNYTGDIYGTGWISEMYGYSFGAAEVTFLYIFISYPTKVSCI